MTHSVLGDCKYDPVERKDLVTTERGDKCRGRGLNMVRHRDQLTSGGLALDESRDNSSIVHKNVKKNVYVSSVKQSEILSQSLEQPLPVV